MEYKGYHLAQVGDQCQWLTACTSSDQPVLARLIIIIERFVTDIPISVLVARQKRFLEWRNDLHYV